MCVNLIVLKMYFILNEKTTITRYYELLIYENNEFLKQKS